MEDMDKNKQTSDSSSLSADLSADLKACQAERDEYLNGWRRSKADLINLKKDMTERLEHTVKFANESILRDLIVIMNSFDLALSAEANPGLEQIKKQLENFLSSHNLKALHLLDKPYNPSEAEAIGEADSDKPPGTVIEEVERGWELNGQVIHPAKVRLAKSK